MGASGLSLFGKDVLRTAAAVPSEPESVPGTPPRCPQTFDWRPSLQVLVRDNNVDQALRVLKKKMQREGIFREMRQRKAYEKPSERKTREKAEAIRRARKAARKLAQREGLLPAPKPKVRPPGRPGAGAAPRP